MRYLGLIVLIAFPILTTSGSAQVRPLPPPPDLSGNWLAATTERIAYSPLGASFSVKQDASSVTITTGRETVTYQLDDKEHPRTTARRRSAPNLLRSGAMHRRSPEDGNVFRMPPKRPHRGNPMEDPLALMSKLAAASGARRVRARDRVEFTPSQVRAIRGQFNQTRPEFAQMMGISSETLRNWECGRRFPTGPARALLRIAAAHPDVVAAVLVRKRVTWLRKLPDPYDERDR